MFRSQFPSTTVWNEAKPAGMDMEGKGILK